jgi:hypothetical protein
VPGAGCQKRASSEIPTKGDKLVFALPDGNDIHVIRDRQVLFVRFDENGVEWEGAAVTAGQLGRLLFQAIFDCHKSQV